MVDLKWPTCISFAILGEEKSTTAFFTSSLGAHISIPFLSISSILYTNKNHKHLKSNNNNKRVKLSHITIKSAPGRSILQTTPHWQNHFLQPTRIPPFQTWEGFSQWPAKTQKQLIFKLITRRGLGKFYLAPVQRDQDARNQLTSPWTLTTSSWHYYYKNQKLSVNLYQDSC